MTADTGVPIMALILNLAALFVGIGLVILLFMLGIKALKALDIYIRKNQSPE